MLALQNKRLHNWRWVYKQEKKGAHDAQSIGEGKCMSAAWNMLPHQLQNLEKEIIKHLGKEVARVGKPAPTSSGCAKAISNAPASTTWDKQVGGGRPVVKPPLPCCLFLLQQKVLQYTATETSRSTWIREKSAAKLFPVLHLLSWIKLQREPLRTTDSQQQSSLSEKRLLKVLQGLREDLR